MALLDVIEEVRREIVDAGSGINEADAKTAFITPILTELGWRGLQRIRSEYPVGHDRMRLDYALIGSDAKPVALVEAKAPRENLASHVDQILNYAFREGVDVCVLTTGILWWLYLPREKGDPAERRFAQLDLHRADAAEVAATFESCLGYGVLTSGAGQKDAKEMLAALHLERQIRNEIPRAWRRLLSGPNEMLVELVREEVEDVLGSRPSYEFVKKELSSITSRSGASPVTDVLRDDSASAPSSVMPMSTITRPTRQVKSPPAQRPVGIRFKGEYRRVSAWNDVLYQLAVLIWERHPNDFNRVLDWGGPNRPYVVLNKDKVPPTRRPKQIPGSPYFLDTNWSSAGVQNRVQELLSLFGYGSNDLEFTFD